MVFYVNTEEGTKDSRFQLRLMLLGWEDTVNKKAVAVQVSGKGTMVFYNVFCI